MSRVNSLTGLACAVAIAAPVLTVWPVAGIAQIDEIVVTTRKREENLQDVPIAVSAIGADDIARLGIDGVADVAKFNPSVQFDNSFGPSDTRVTVRGLSNTRGRSNVAFLVDGIDVTTENLIAAGSGLLSNRRLLGDIERVEVIKGPQSALYGRAAFAGALSYITKDPGEEFEGRYAMDVGQDGQYQFDLALGGPVIGDVLGMRVNAVYWQEDGRYVNTVSNKSVGGGEGYGVAWKTVFTPDDATKISMRLEYSDEEYEPRAAARVGGGLPLESKPTPDGSQQRDFPDGAILTCESGNSYVPFPQAALDRGIGNASQGGPFQGRILGLNDFGPGLCVPKSFGSGDNLTIAQSEDPLTGQDYEGTDTESFRAQISGTFDAEFGTFSINSGWTDFQASEEYDQDYQAVGRPDTLLAGHQAKTDIETTQFSTELRFRSNWEGPFQTTLGALFWDEDRHLDDRNIIVLCAPVGKLVDANSPPVSPIAGICDGTAGSVSSYQQRYQELPRKGESDIRGVVWNAETEHLSFYAMLEWEMTETTKLTIEDRAVDEDFFLFKPAESSCTNAGFAAPAAPVGNFPLVAETDTTDVVCESERILRPAAGQVTDPTDNWSYVQGSTSSHFHTPKVTVEWAPTDDSLFYFFWAAAQKPGGIAVTIGGGSPVPLREDRFEPEKLDAWEFGSKLSFDWLGSNQLNTAFFLQDYTDKQIGTQVLVNGQLNPRIINAAAAEIWGLELEWTWQPEFLEGLAMQLAYTYLDAEFVDFTQGSTSAQRAAAFGDCAVPTAEQIAGGIAPGACAFDFSGNKLDRTPEHAFVAIVQYSAPVPNRSYDWFIDANANWQDKRFVDEENLVQFDPLWLVDTRVGLSGDNWQALIYVDNLLDDDTIQTGGPGPDFGEQVTETGFLAGFGISHWFAVLPEPRTFGVRISYDF